MSTDPLLAIVKLLNAGAFSTAIPQLYELSRVQTQRPDVHFNLGLALSATRQFPEAVIALARTVALDPTHAPAWDALGVAYSQLRRLPEALEAFDHSIRLRPEDGNAYLNRAAVLGMLDRREPALESARVAARLLPPSERVQFALADAMRFRAMEPDYPGNPLMLLSEADELYEALLEQYPNSPMVEEFEKARSAIARRNLEEGEVGGLRYDVVEYIAAGLKLFDDIGPDARNRAVLEIAKVGADGFDINDPTRKFALSTLPGEYTALHLLALMYAGLKLAAPRANAGIDFSREFEAAQALYPYMGPKKD